MNNCHYGLLDMDIKSDIICTINRVSNLVLAFYLPMP